MAWGPGRIALVAVVVLIAFGDRWHPGCADVGLRAPDGETSLRRDRRAGAQSARCTPLVFPGFHSEVRQRDRSGMQQDVRVPSVTAYMDLGSLFARSRRSSRSLADRSASGQRRKSWRGCHAGSAGEEAQGRTSSSAKIVFKGHQGGREGRDAAGVRRQRVSWPRTEAVTRATIETGGGRFDAEVLPERAEADVDLRVKGSTLPLGPALELVEGTRPRAC